MDVVGRRYGDRIALRRLDRDDRYVDVTFRALAERVARTTGRLQDLGLRPGDRVVIMGANAPAWIVGAFAVLAAGAVLVPVDAKSKEAEVAHITSASGATFMLADGSCLGDMTVRCPVTLTLGETPERGAPALEASDAPAAPRRSVSRRPDDMALLVYTSGTTGVSKGVMLSHRNILADVTAIARRIPLLPDDTVLSILPLSHMFEFTCGLVFPLLQGCATTYLRSLQGREILLNMQRSSTRVMIAVPRIFGLLRNRIEGEIARQAPWKQTLVRLAHRVVTRFPSLGRLVFRRIHETFGGRIRFLVVGGAPVHPGLVAFFNGLGIPLIQGYGLTETSPVLTACPLADNRVGTAGPPVDGVEIRIDGPEGVPGEIVVRGPTVMLGYYGDPEATAAVLRGGWLHTGDLGTMDRDGFLTIRGRRKALIVTANGKNVYPEELEAVLGQSPLVRELCVVAQREEDGVEEKPYAFVVADPDAARERLGRVPTPDELERMVGAEIRRLGAGLSDYKRLAGFELHADELPKTPTHKVRRFLLQERLDARIRGAGLDEPASAPTPDMFAGRSTAAGQSAEGD